MSASGSITDPDITLDVDKALEAFNKSDSSNVSGNILSAAVSAQEFMHNCKYLLEYERQMFLDICHSDGLLIAAK